MRVIVSIYKDGEIIVFTETKYYQLHADVLECYHESNTQQKLEDLQDSLVATEFINFYKFHTIIEVDEQLDLLSQIKEQLPEVFL